MIKRIEDLICFECQDNDYLLKGNDEFTVGINCFVGDEICEMDEDTFLKYPLNVSMVEPLKNNRDFCITMSLNVEETERLYRYIGDVLALHKTIKTKKL